MTHVLLVLLTVVVIGVPLLASLLVCAPKWWEARVEDHLPGWMQASARDPEKPFAWELFLGKERGGPAIRWVWMLPLALVATLVLAVVWYVVAFFQLIERKCPYTPEQNYELQPGQTNVVNPSGALRSVWSYTWSR